VQEVDVARFRFGIRMAGPWNLVAGNLIDLRLPDAVIVDENLPRYPGDSQPGGDG